jgi:hypothetical protein
MYNYFPKIDGKFELQNIFLARPLRATMKYTVDDQKHADKQ